MIMRTRTLAAGTSVKVARPGAIPEWSKWDDDGYRTSNSVKRRLQRLFFNGDRKIQARVVYISSEHERSKLKAKGHTKVELRDPAGSSVTILADANNLTAA